MLLKHKVACAALKIPFLFGRKHRDQMIPKCLTNHVAGISVRCMDFSVSAEHEKYFFYSKAGIVRKFQTSENMGLDFRLVSYSEALTADGHSHSWLIIQII